MKTVVKRLDVLRSYVFWIMLWPYLVLITASVSECKAQEIRLNNPSLEGTAGNGIVPTGWILCGRTPDVQPVAKPYCGVTKEPADGSTYVGLLSVGDIYEGISQKLSTAFTAYSTYALSYDIAFPGTYCTSLDYGAIAIYGGSSPGDRRELLYSSTDVNNTEWRRDTVRFSPSESWTYLTITSYLKPADEANHSKTYYSALLIDNLSTFISEIPSMKVSVYNTCRGVKGGQAAVSVLGGLPPFKYEWNPGNMHGDTVSNLPSGRYSVTVTAANGISVSDTFMIREYELGADIKVLGPSCYGFTDGEISIRAKNGVGPYIFSIDNGNNFSGDSVFGSLRSGRYNVVIKDVNQCTIEKKNLRMTQPEPLRVNRVSTVPVACSDVKNGRVSFDVAGGTPPYAYAVPGFVSQQEDSVIRKLDQGNYTYEVTDIRSCIVEGDFSVSKEWRDCAVFMPNAFSPNGDGINDLFRAVVHDDLSDFRMQIYGRWGQMIFETQTPEKGWDGTQKGQPVPTGAYLWVVTYTDSKNQAIKQTGSLVVVR